MGGVVMGGVRHAHLRSCNADACTRELVPGRAGVLNCTWLPRPIILVLVYPFLNWYRSVVTHPTLVYLVYPDINTCCADIDTCRNLLAEQSVCPTLKS